MKGRDNCSSPDLPDVAISRDEPLTHDKVQDLRQEALGVFGCICHQHLQHHADLSISQDEGMRTPILDKGHTTISDLQMKDLDLTKIFLATIMEIGCSMNHQIKCVQVCLLLDAGASCMEASQVLRPCTSMTLSVNKAKHRGLVALCRQILSRLTSKCPFPYGIKLISLC